MVEFLLDTGSTHSILSKNVLDSIPSEVRPPLTADADGSTIRGFDGSQANVLGASRLDLKFPNLEFNWKFNIADAKCINILGLDFMTHFRVNLDYDQNVITYCENKEELNESIQDYMRCEARACNHVFVPANSEHALQVTTGNELRGKTVLVEGNPITMHNGFLVGNTLSDVSDR